MYIGSRKWMNTSHGQLGFKDKTQLIKQILYPVTLDFFKAHIKKNSTDVPLEINDIIIPDTALIKDAINELEQCRNIAIIQHSWRSYFWAVAIAKYKKWQFDSEDLLFASLIHDLGLISPKSEYSTCQCFTFKSALQAEDLCKKHHHPQDRTENISNAICLHMNGYLNERNLSLSKEVFLLQQATACDVIGTNIHCIDKSYYNNVLLRHPRYKFNTEFQKLIETESRRHPQSRTALLNKLGLNIMIKLNKHGE
ncbi:HD domain-containing protein [Acinetobacter stercoris]|uniref:HD domain protein n=1 Tax=Acinetobacter stercoris TaxID=2126983 RepID=A0A2U3MW50_9GAMM|nr:HD domain-containing protein [Acinetobacter stercoris]SPL69583.1 HD domain protein [Acinetobacter stercoris]